MKKSRCFLLGCMFERGAPCVMNELTREKVGNNTFHWREDVTSARQNN